MVQFLLIEKRNDGTIVNKSEVKMYQKYTMIKQMFNFMDSVSLNQGFILTNVLGAFILHSECPQSVVLSIERACSKLFVVLL